MAKECSILYMYHVFFIHFSVDGHLGCFYVLAVVNSAAMNIGVHESFWTMTFSGYKPSSGIVGSCGRFLRNLHTLICSDCINLRFHQECKRVPSSLHPLFLDNSCLNLLFGTPGTSWRLKSIPCRQETGDTERLPCPGAPQGPAHTMTIPLNILVYIQYWSLIYSFFLIVC